MDLDVKEISGACHCGAARFLVRLTDGCAPPGAAAVPIAGCAGPVAVSANIDGIEILSGADILSEYRFNTMSAKHYFCSKCGIYTHHQRRSNPNLFGVNVACLAG